jgi:choice-of-anchor A domain-containing protein
MRSTRPNRGTRRASCGRSGSGRTATLVEIGVLASSMFLTLGAPAIAGAATCATLSSSWQYGMFTSGNATIADTDSKLPVAIGGNGSLTSYSANSSQSVSYTGTALAVAGALTTTNGGTADGKVFVGSPPIVQNSGGFTYNTPLLTADPLNFSSELSNLQTLSTNLSTGTTTAGTTVTPPSSGNGETLTLTGASGAALDVFNLTGAADVDLVNAKTINIVGTAAGATVLINTDLTSFNATTNLQSTQSGNTPPATNVVWNFPDATSLTFSNAGWYGTVLAPFTTTTAATFAQIDGSVLLGGNAGTTATPWTAEVESDAFAGCLPVLGNAPALPDGLPLELGALALVGVGTFVAMTIRRRVTAAKAIVA